MTGPTRRLGGDWYVAVQKRLPGHPVTSLTGPQFGILLDALLDLCERIRGWLQPVWGEAAAASVVVFSAILDRLAGYGG